MKAKQITLPDGKRIQAQFLGAGAFAKCYLAQDGFVYSIVKNGQKESDYSKQAVGEWADSDNLHIPEIEFLGEDDNNCLIYKAVYYQNKLTAAHSSAWAEYKTLKRIWMDNINFDRLGFVQNNKIIDLARAAGVKESICDALQSISDSCRNYGDFYFLEFRTCNLKVNDAGELILLDAIFNKKALYEAINKKLHG